MKVLYLYDISFDYVETIPLGTVRKFYVYTRVEVDSTSREIVFMLFFFCLWKIQKFIKCHLSTLFFVDMKVLSLLANRKVKSVSRVRITAKFITFLFQQTPLVKHWVHLFFTPDNGFNINLFSWGKHWIQNQHEVGCAPPGSLFSRYTLVVWLHLI